jgi:hypothetical protein
VNLPDDKLTPDQLEARAVMYLYKGIDGMRAPEQLLELGRDIAKEWGIAVAKGLDPSPELQARFKQYEMMVNKGGEFTLEQQTAAIQNHLTCDSEYLKNNPKLLKQITDAVIQDTQKNNWVYRLEAVDKDRFYRNYASNLNATHTTAPAIATQENQTTQTISTLPCLPVPDPAEPAVVAPAADSTEKATLAQRSEGSKGAMDDFFISALESSVRKALKGLETKVVMEALGEKLGEFNVGDKNFISIHEVENALVAAGVTGEQPLTLETITAALTPKTPDSKSGPQIG